MRNQLSRAERTPTTPPRFAALIGFGVRWVRLAGQVELIDRSMGLAAQFLGSLIPLVIVIAALVPFRDDPQLWTGVARWLGLRGSSQSTLHALIGSSGQLTVDVTGISAFLLFIAAFSFVRALQRAYEHVWMLKPLSVRNLVRQVVWLIVFAASLMCGYGLRWLSDQVAPLTPLLLLAGAFLTLAVWWLTPYLLLGGRVGWRKLLPGAFVSWATLIGYGTLSSFYMPGRIDASADQFGPIGLIFIILSWEFILFCIVVAGACIGPALLEGENGIARWMRGEREMPE